MKKVLALLTIALCVGTAAMAQGGGQPRQTPEERKAAMVERLKPLNLTPVQLDSATTIWMDRGAMGNFRDMTPEQRQEAQKTMMESRNKRLEKALGADLAKKVVDAMPQMGQRPGGGGGGK